MSMTLQDFALSPRRIGAILLRHLYVLRSSWPRLVEMAYWPTMQMIIWGFVSQFFYTQTSYVAQAFGVLMAGVMLWDVLFRGQLGFSLSFLEEMWAHNLANLYVSPLRPAEHILALMAMSVVRTLIGVLPAAVLAILLYKFSIFDMGLPLLAFYVNLVMMAWGIGMLSTSLLMRYGLGAENLVWFIIFLLAPISAIYYPVTVLPAWLQPIAWCLPSTHVFEGMREVLFHQHFNLALFWGAVGLNVIYILVGLGVYLIAFRSARERGALLQMGE
ncbi:ABC transporter [Hypericibacter terrae]|uniref:Transport permease protein n=1 Tax=Hypericibacter terrae TaxID=2602015 RepID=A0A5J6MC22_9PROT|nr:ABC transporter permease [Hypericibacter terrae]QEX14763.1 ABC transporter [Hypericibacter terrae]